MDKTEIFGKCNYINLQTGLKCGCLRYRNIHYENLLCEGCTHDQTFHEKDSSPQILTQMRTIKQLILN